jgi:hypothetical protein
VATWLHGPDGCCGTHLHRPGRYPRGPLAPAVRLASAGVETSPNVWTTMTVSARGSTPSYRQDGRLRRTTATTGGLVLVFVLVLVLNSSKYRYLGILSSTPPLLRCPRPVGAAKHPPAPRTTRFTLRTTNPTRTYSLCNWSLRKSRRLVRAATLWRHPVQRYAASSDEALHNCPAT